MLARRVVVRLGVGAAAALALLAAAALHAEGAAKAHREVQAPAVRGAQPISSLDRVYRADMAS
jgi:hypothetical protein